MPCIFCHKPLPSETAFGETACLDCDFLHTSRRQLIDNIAHYQLMIMNATHHIKIARRRLKIAQKTYEDLLDYSIDTMN